MEHTHVRLLGFHPLKHALRFEADVIWAVSTDKKKLMHAAAQLAPDVGAWVEAHVREISEREFLALGPYAKGLEVIAEAKRPAIDTEVLLQAQRERPAVVLENPRHLGNIGAVIRTAAAAGASMVVTTGEADPWHPTALRGSAGLHFALPVVRIPDIGMVSPSRVALHPDGRLIGHNDLRREAAYLFGTERHGLSHEALHGADDVVRLPMQEGVSSLNVAASVAAVLYAWHLREQ